MQLRFSSVKIVACLLLSGLGLALHAGPVRVLYFTKSSGFEHSVVKRPDGQPSYSENILTQLSAANDLAFTFSKDGSLFSPEYLADFDVLLFYTSGDLLSAGTDGQPAMTPQGKEALLRAVSEGKGFVGVHSCSDTFHTNETGGGNPRERAARFKNYGEAADPFIRMLGGEFIRHGAQQTATARVVSPQFPGFGKLGAEINTHEEWYSLKEFAPDMHALLVLETAGMKGADYERPPFPVAWARPFGKGRVAYHAMGHREEIWDSPEYQAMLVGAIAWAAGKRDADVSPNLRTAAPGHATLPLLESSQ
jgi:type 1 glutamine amidotransferase